MSRKTFVWAAALAATGLAVTSAGGAAGASNATGQPAPIAPSTGKHVQSLPYFAWTTIRGADHYEFAVAADASFNSPVLGSDGHFTTNNARATLKKTLPNGKYWWHARAVTNTGGIGPWSAARPFVVAWQSEPKLLAPVNGNRVEYPAPLILRWSPVAGAAMYEVSIATDARLGSLITSRPIETSATTLAPATALHAGTYYWAVTPVDAEGNNGTRSAVRSFDWAWTQVPTSLSVQDLVGPGSLDTADFGASTENQLYLPQFHWHPVPGASRYELEINSDRTWAVGSRVCCTNKILASTFTPTDSLRSNKYYWRVRAFDARGNPGGWAPTGDGTDANSFVKTFDNVCTPELVANCVPAGQPSIQNLRIEDWSGAPVTGGSTSSPLAIWDPVPGASAYEYDVTRFANGVCDFTWPGNDHWRGTTATNAWSPLGRGPSPMRPYPVNISLNSDSHAPVPGAHYCVRVRAQTERAGNTDVFGDFTTISDAFTFAGPQVGATGGIGQPLGSGDYLTPAQGQALRQMPVLRWRPINGAKSYWVIVAKDSSFTTVVDYAFTQLPVYAPRANSGTVTYPDETTTYYWIVLPSPNTNGSGASGDPVNAPHGTFQKQVPPASPQVTIAEAQPIFHWKPVVGALDYQIEVSADPNFGDTVEKATTPSTSYTAAVTYPPAKRLYWRVRADDDKKIGLSWQKSSFEYHLPVPAVGGNATKGDTLPTWRWKSVPGAVSYDLHVDLPDGTHRDLNDLLTAACTPTKMTGTGIFHWKVRANFPNSSGSTHGPYSRPLSFARTITPPKSAQAIGGGDALVLTWKPKFGVKQYKIQISSKPDFSSSVESANVDNPVYAPFFKSYSYKNGGRFYWRVAAVDADGNSGDYTKTAFFASRRR